ncbi:hypothetical protein EON65_24030 [archaeon]|nr:MAG: hypothetical protein EON65_24030 [archaeon]
MDTIDLTDQNGTSGSARPARVRKARPSFDEMTFDNLPDTPTEPKKKKKKSSGKPLNEGRLSDQSSHFIMESASLHFSSNKRPRGRPPLSGKKSLGSSDLNDLSSMHIPQPVTFVAPQYPVKSSSSMYTQDPPFSFTKSVRPPFTVVATQLVSLLMTSDPLTLQELSRNMNDCPKDMIQSVLDLLQVFDLVMQVKAKGGYRPDIAGGGVLYCLQGFVKGPEAVPLEDLLLDIQEREVSMELIQKRNDQIKVRITFHVFSVISLLFLCASVL